MEASNTTNGRTRDELVKLVKQVQKGILTPLELSERLTREEWDIVCEIDPVMSSDPTQYSPVEEQFSFTQHLRERLKNHQMLRLIAEHDDADIRAVVIHHEFVMRIERVLWKRYGIRPTE